MEKNYVWGHDKLYNDFGTFFRKKFDGKRVQKVSIDAGFTCPNRDGSKGKGGCTYCNNTTFKPTYTNLRESVTQQIDKGVTFFEKKYKEIDFLAYFQAYSNTYASMNVLRSFYEEALNHPKVVGLVIATRPDCLSDEVLDYLEEVSKTHYVMIEMGIESTNDDVLEHINRGHTYAETIATLKKITERNLPTCGHVILGLPGDDRDRILQQAKDVNELPLKNLKLHQLQIHKGTLMANEYEEFPERFVLRTIEEYIDLVIDYLELLRPDMILERFISFAPKELLIAPRWGHKNFEFVAKLEKRMAERNTYQGRLYK